jgi:hypothetical protein
MKKIQISFLAAFALIGSTSCSSTRSAERTISSEILTPWLTTESKAMFDRADRTDFYPLVNQFEAQENKFFCGPATAVIVLNTLRLRSPDAKLPRDPNLYRGDLKTLPNGYDPVFERYSQYTFFNKETDKVKTLKQVFGEKMQVVKDKPEASDYGIQLRQFADMLKTHGLAVNVRVVSDETKVEPGKELSAAQKSKLDEIKSDIIGNLKREGDYVIVNYARPAVGQKGGGHISPLAAYDERTDSVLIMDVNPSHQPWVWVKLNDLMAAMRTFDTVENRGYILVSK